MIMAADSLEDFGIDAPKHNRKILRLAPDGVPDRIPRGEELRRMNEKCDRFLRSRGIHQMTAKEWLYPNSTRRRKTPKKMLTKNGDTELINTDYERDCSR
ncbi:hypothetical protein EBZ80_07105 [bacterium]|nr:hypothetical protein [bacterium]